jgi:tetratricopeptide (TPR) repeat protein
MTATSDKARNLRLERLQRMLDEELTQPPAALETLLSELSLGETRADDWKALHIAATRDNQEVELGTAYQKVLTRHRLRTFDPDLQARVLLHAADFFQGMLGDDELAIEFLERILEVVPDHEEAFDRLDRRRQREGDKRKLVDLYALVARRPLIPVERLASRVVDLLIVPLPADAPLKDETCRRLLALVPSRPKLMNIVYDHCKRTSRRALGRRLREQALEAENLPEQARVELQRGLLECYLEEGVPPESAIEHAEFLLTRDPSDNVAARAAQKLLRVPAVASRAAAMLKDRRLSSRPPPRES